MKSNMKKRLIYVLWVFLIVLQTGYLIYTFTSVKKGFFSDEIWSYGLANSYYQPFVTIRDNVFIDDGFQYEDFVNMNQWVPGRAFKNYITVQPGEQFAYDSVYHNQTLDHHPPLFYMLLHTVSSFFPDQFSWWYGFSFCLVFFWITQWFLFLTGRELMGSDMAALLACCLYGGGTGMLCTFAFIRQYSLLTMLCMIFLYLALRLYREDQTEGKFRKKTLAAIAVTAFLAFMTHYYAIAFVGIYTALYCLYLLIRRRFKQMFLFGGSMLAMLLAFMAVYPAFLFQVFNSDTKVAQFYGLATSLRILISHMFYCNFGFRTPYFATAFWNITIPLVIAAVVVAVMLLFPFRKEPWCLKLVENIKRLPGKLWRYLKGMNYVPVFALLAGFSIYLIVARISGVVPGDAFLLRYISLTFPVIVMVAVALVYGILRRISYIRKWGCAILAVMVLAEVFFVRITVPYPFVFEEYGDEREIQDITVGKRILVINDFSAKSLINSTCFSLYLSNAEECFFTASDEIREDWPNVLTRKDSVDYILISSRCINLESENQPQGFLNCSDLVDELCAGKGYHFVKSVSIQTGEYFLLEIGG